MLRSVTLDDAAAVRSDRSGERLALRPRHRELGIVLDHHLYPAEHRPVSSVDGCEQSSLSSEILVKVWAYLDPKDQLPQVLAGRVDVGYETQVEGDLRCAVEPVTVDDVYGHGQFLANSRAAASFSNHDVQPSSPAYRCTPTCCGRTARVARCGTINAMCPSRATIGFSTSIAL